MSNKKLQPSPCYRNSHWGGKKATGHNEALIISVIKRILVTVVSLNFICACCCNLIDPSV